MHIDRATMHRVDELARHEVPVRRPHERVRPQGDQVTQRIAAESIGLQDGDAEPLRLLLHRRRRDPPAMSRPVRLRHGRDEVDRAAVAQARERLERGDGEDGRAEKDDPRGYYALTSSVSPGSTV